MSEPVNTIDRVTIRGVTYYLRDNSVIDGVWGGMPVVTAEDNGSILRVVNGFWAVVQVDSAEEEEF